MAFSSLVIRQYLRLRSLWRTWRSTNPPPASPPEEQMDAFTLGGRIPLRKDYFNDVVDKPLRWTPRSPWWNLRKARRDVTRYYGATDRYFYEALQKHPICGRDVVVVGSEMPWYECICVSRGANVTTIEYRRIDCRIPGLTVLTPDEFARCPRTFDCAVSISSIEHDGLGRYGDPIRADGDLEALRGIRSLLRPGGLLYLAVPVGADALVWNAHRIYGRLRLPRLLAGWEVVDQFGCDDGIFDRSVGVWEPQPVFVLRPGQ